MKIIFIVEAVLASIFSLSIQASEIGIMDNTASANFNYSAHEGEAGYSLDIHWQMNKHLEVTAGVDSYLSNESYSTASIFLETSKNPEDYSPERFRPRHNDYSFGVTLRYPIAFANKVVLSPYLNLGINKLSTKALIFEPVSSSGGETSSTLSDIPIRFSDLDAFKVGAGVQIAIDDIHGLRVGLIGYSNDQDWDELDIEKDERGGYLRYEYRPSNNRFGFVTSISSVDQFGSPSFKVGLSWAFN
jgi:hypothetical protein